MVLRIVALVAHCFLGPAQAGELYLDPITGQGTPTNGETTTSIVTDAPDTTLPEEPTPQPLVIVVNPSSLDKIVGEILPETIRTDFGRNDFSVRTSSDSCVKGKVSACQANSCIVDGVCNFDCWKAGYCTYASDTNDIFGGRTRFNGYFNASVMAALYGLHFKDTVLDLSLPAPSSFKAEFGDDRKFKVHSVIAAEPIFQTTMKFVLNGDEGANEIDYKGTVKLEKIDNHIEVQFEENKLELSGITQFHEKTTTSLSQDITTSGVGYTVMLGLANVLLLGIEAATGILYTSAGCTSIQACLDMLVTKAPDMLLNSDYFKSTILADSAKKSIGYTKMTQGTASLDSVQTVTYAFEPQLVSTTKLTGNSENSLFVEWMPELTGSANAACASALSWSAPVGEVPYSSYSNAGDFSVIFPIWTIENVIYLLAKGGGLCVPGPLVSSSLASNEITIDPQQTLDPNVYALLQRAGADLQKAIYKYSMALDIGSSFFVGMTGDGSAVSFVLGLTPTISGSSTNTALSVTSSGLKANLSAELGLALGKNSLYMKPKSAGFTSVEGTLSASYKTSFALTKLNRKSCRSVGPVTCAVAGPTCSCTIATTENFSDILAKEVKTSQNGAITKTSIQSSLSDSFTSMGNVTLLPRVMSFNDTYALKISGNTITTLSTSAIQIPLKLVKKGDSK